MLQERKKKKKMATTRPMGDGKLIREGKSVTNTNSTWLAAEGELSDWIKKHKRSISFSLDTC